MLKIYFPAWNCYRNQKSLMQLLNSCAKEKNLSRVRIVHANILKAGLLDLDIYLSSSLVNLYAKCNGLVEAQNIFDNLPVKNVVCWNALISGYAQYGHGKFAMDLFSRMLTEGQAPSSVTIVCILKACGSSRDTVRGQQIHASLVRDLLFENVLVANALIDMYSKCTVLTQAHAVIKELQVCDVVSWNALMTGYAQFGDGEEVTKCFEQMQQEGISPDAVTLLCLLKAYSSNGTIYKGKELHARSAEECLLKENVMIGNAMVDMYAKSGAVEKAQEMFDELPLQNEVSWNSLITGYAQHGHNDKALDCFGQMQHKGLSPNAVTYACILKACGNVGAIGKGLELHADIERKRLSGGNIIVATALIDMYTKCGVLSMAQEVFDGFHIRDVVLWTALISGYAQYEYSEQALKCFDLMQEEHVTPNTFTYTCILKVCGDIGSLAKGEEIHADIVRGSLLYNDVMIQNALLDMYAKNGAISKAQMIFDEMPTRDVVAYTALMAGYSQIGKENVVCEIYKKMIDDGITPSLITFTVVLNACSHLGMLHKAASYLSIMNTNYRIEPTREHFTCLVDLESRVGNFDNAVEIIRKMPDSEYLPVWTALLSACQKWGNLNLGKWAFEHAVELDKMDASTHICMSNICVGTST